MGDELGGLWAGHTCFNDMIVAAGQWQPQKK